MSRLIASILLSILLFPLASLAYLVVFFVWMRSSRWSPRRENWGFAAAGLVTWAFIAVYWFALWRKSVHWTSERTAWTFVSAGGAALVGVLLGVLTGAMSDSFGVFLASTSAPLLWLVATVFLWRESAAERGGRVNSAGGEGVVCPVCGYNLTGLRGTRCPECGKEYTLDELLASQPGRAMAELER